ncbi:transporter substrate-binding domain-containing protein [Psychromonas sp. 14N.309.X.WAT.B.A12]|uniref:transporter substrate-binding domain-containing diguanylate cyclase n=1 Tax=Psychromonas sp. 14N.309.X.WAT.B.A12 TaxID=2998322 RepID=UPI0025B13C33|nr:transporter substrate-binding domain-containing protein [Psychromonas sp. 14N.309.X.WAT.B.A12]MDN2664005.1 transporter substrate-binding domain-containing protein [Psychromonas sp. 14N.309.X.WAT.B.A12]
MRLSLPPALITMINIVFMTLAFAHNAFAQLEKVDVEFTDQEKQYIKDHPIIKVHTAASWHPFNYIENGKASGYNNDLIRLVAERAGLNIEFVVGYEWSEYLEKLKNKEIDVISNMKITPERQKFTTFTHYQTLSSVDGLLTRSGEVFLNDLSDIQSIAVIKDFYYEELLRKYYPDIHLMVTNTTEEAIQLLVEEKVNGVLDSYDAINYYVERSLLQNLVNTALIDHKIFHYLPKFMGVQKGNLILRDILDKGLLSLNKQDIDKLHQKWKSQISFGKSSYAVNYQDRLPILSSRQQNYLDKHGALIMCVDPDWLPIEAIRHGKHIGISAEFVRLFAQRISSPIELLETSTWAETLQALKDGTCDFTPTIKNTPSRKEFLSFTPDYVTFPLALITEEDNHPYKLQQVLHKPLGMLKDGSYRELLSERYSDTQFHEFRTLKEGLDAVSDGDIYGFIDVLPVMVNQIQHGYPNLKIVDQFESDYSFALAVEKGNLPLLSIFNKVIESISLQKKQEILNKWLPALYERKTSVQGYLIAVIGMSLIIFLLLLLLFSNKMKYVKLQKKNTHLEKLAMRDYLTSLPNQAYFNEFFKKEWVRSRRSGENISLLLIDVDNTKLINEQHGRSAGDQCLIELAQRLNNVIQRPADLLARLEQDTFAVLLPDTSEEGVKALTAEIFYMVNSWSFSFKGMNQPDSITVSIGAACMVSNGDYLEDELSRRAEQALYQAQDKGKGKLVIYKK